MMHKYILIAVLALVMSAVFGWWRAAIATQQGAVPGDEWRVSSFAQVDSRASQQLGQSSTQSHWSSFRCHIFCLVRANYLEKNEYHTLLASRGDHRAAARRNP